MSELAFDWDSPMEERRWFGDFRLAEQSWVVGSLNLRLEKQRTSFSVLGCARDDASVKRHGLTLPLHLLQVLLLPFSSALR